MSAENDNVAGPSVVQELEFIKGPKNKDILVRGQRRHFLHHTLKKDGSQVWKCTNNKNCRAKVKIIDGIIIEEDMHTCTPTTKLCTLKEDFKRECLQLLNQNKHIPITKAYKDIKKDFLDKGLNFTKDLPSYESVKSSLYRHRNSTLNVKKTTFTNIQDVEVPQCFEDFLLFDHKEEGQRILIFSTEQGRQLMEEKEVFFMDGTFKSCAAPFYQLYTIHVDIGSDDKHTKIIPVIFSLLPNKNQTTYEVLFKSVKMCLPNWTPSKVLVDFEQGSINAIKNILPDTTVKGCFFHFKKALLKKSKDIGISTQEDKDHVLRCAALARLPIVDVEEGWLSIMETSPPNQKITDFNNYFVDIWLDNRNLHYSIWNCEGERHCTTNLCEAWHKTINGELKKKPRLLELLFKIREHADYFNKYYHPSNNRRKTTINRVMKIKTIENTYREKKITIMEALNKYKNL